MVSMPGTSFIRTHLAKLVLHLWVFTFLAVFVAGAWKTLRPVGYPPPIVASLIGDADYGSYLRGLGIVEVLVALLFLPSSTRRLAGLATAGLLFTFSIIIAMSADDVLFVRRCGCFGSLSIPGVAAHSAEGLILRNAALCFGALAAIGYGMVRRRQWVAFTLCCGACLLTLVALLLLASHAQRRQWQSTATYLATVAETQARERVELASLRLRDLDGEPVDAVRALGTPAHVIVFSPTCEACGKEASNWLPLMNSAAESGENRFVLGVGSLRKVSDFVASHGLPRERTLWSEFDILGHLGVTSLPCHVRFGDQGQILAMNGWYGASRRGLANLIAGAGNQRAFRELILLLTRTEGPLPEPIAKGPNDVMWEVPRGSGAPVRVFLSSARNAYVGIVELLIELAADGQLLRCETLAWDVPSAVPGGQEAVLSGLPRSLESCIAILNAKCDLEGRGTSPLGLVRDVLKRVNSYQ